MAATVFNDAQVDIINMMQWVKSPEALADLKQAISDFFAKKVKEETKHEYDDRCIEMLMKKIAVMLPESYRGVYE